jgi:hypothetical protein
MDEPKPKRARRSSILNLPPVEVDPNKYRATDDDLPINMWPEPTFEEDENVPTSS